MPKVTKVNGTQCKRKDINSKKKTTRTNCEIGDIARYRVDRDGF